MTYLGADTGAVSLIHSLSDSEANDRPAKNGLNFQDYISSIILLSAILSFIIFLCFLFANNQQPLKF